MYPTFRRNPGESTLQFMSVERELYRLRDKQYPNIPRTDKDIERSLKDPNIFEKYGKTLNNQYDFYFDSVINEKYAFHVFASLATISLIKDHIAPEHRNYLMDGTFKIIPREHNQLLIVSIEYKNDASIHFFNQSCAFEPRTPYHHKE